jgi:nucleotide-binding universal stress UspA family protein
MYEILLPVDTNMDRTREQLGAIQAFPGDADEVSVTILHAFTDNPSGATVGQLSTVRHAEETLEDAGYEVTLSGTSGAAAGAILEAAANEDADLICLGGRKQTPTGKVLFGSVTQSVLLDADRPVLVAPSPD